MIRAPQESRTYFVTTVTANRRRLLQVETTACLMLDVLQGYRAQNRFALHAFVIMPDHLHILLTPAPDVSLEKAVQYIKGKFSFQFKSKIAVWERSYNEAQILTPEKFHACRHYIEQIRSEHGFQLVQRTMCIHRPIRQRESIPCLNISH